MPEWFENESSWIDLRNKWILIKEDTVKTFRFDLTIYSGQELRSLLETVGFRDVRLYGDLDGAKYGNEAQRLIVVAKKPE